MVRTRICLAAMLLAASLHAASAQTAAAPATTAPATTTAPAATTEAKPGKVKLSKKLKDMKAKWSANKPKLKACRAEVKAKGLAGDDRWFYIEECMNKS